MPKTVVIQTAFLGDVVLTTPLLNALAEQCGAVDVVTRPNAAPLLEHLPSVHEVLPFDKYGTDKGMLGLLRMAHRLKQRNYSTAYLPHTSHRTALLATLAGIPKRIGFANAAGRWALTSKRTARGATEVDRITSLAESPDPQPRPTIRLTQDEHKKMATLLSANHIGDFVVVAPGATWSTKKWNGFRRLTTELAQQMSVVSIGLAEDRGALDVDTNHPFPCLDLAGRLTLRESAAVVSLARVAVTNDSAPLHIANAVGTPVVAVFGPTAPHQGFGPCGDQDIVVEHQLLSCRPCSPHGSTRCPLGHHACMTDIDGADVLAAVVKFLKPATSGTSA